MTKPELEKIAVAQGDSMYSIFKYYNNYNKWFETAIYKDKGCLEGYLRGLVESSNNLNIILENGIPKGFKSIHSTKPLEKKLFEDIVFFAKLGDVE